MQLLAEILTMILLGAILSASIPLEASVDRNEYKIERIYSWRPVRLWEVHVIRLRERK